MRNLLCFFITLIVPISLFSQSAHGRYASRITPDGTIFFIEPKGLNIKSNIKRFEYDMTLLSWTDSVTLNFTVESFEMFAPEDFKILCGDNTYSADEFSVLFIDIKKGHYEIRITSKFSFLCLSKMLESEVSPVFAFMQNGVLRKASYKKSEWKKEQKKLSDIVQIYNYSKK